MYGKPPDVKTTVFARLPDRWRAKGRRSEWAFGKDTSALHSFLEGPSFDRAGNLYVSDIPYGRIFKVSPQGEFALIAEYDGEPNGMAFHQDGRLYAADHKNGIVRIDPATGKVEYLLRRLRREGFKGLNDLTFDSRGNLYFNDQGQTGMQDPTGRVYRLGIDGRIDLLIDTVPSPNGMALSPDERLLYVAATRANQIWRLPLHGDGSSTKAGIHLHMQGGRTGPDGLAVDAQGNLLVCQCGSDSIWLFSPSGEPLARIRTCAGDDMTNAAWRPGTGTLFITEAARGEILTAELTVPGLTLFSHREDEPAEAP